MITVTATGGWGTYQYSDNGGGVWQTSNIFTGLIAGTYDVVIRRCCPYNVQSGSGHVIVLQPTALGGTTAYTNVNCFDGAMVRSLSLQPVDGLLMATANDGGTTWQSSNIFNRI